MASDRKAFGAVATMRKMRDRLSRQFKSMTFAEQKREMESLAKRPPGAEVRPTRRSAQQILIITGYNPHPAEWKSDWRALRK